MDEAEEKMPVGFYHRYICLDGRDDRYLPIESWPTIPSQSESIFEKTVDGFVSFVKSGRVAVATRLSLFVEKISSGKTFHKGYFYIKIFPTCAREEIDKFIDYLGAKLYFDTTELNLYKIYSPPTQESIDYYFIEFPNSKIFGHSVNVEQNLLGKIYNLLTGIINSHIITNDFNITIDSKLYRRCHEASIKYYFQSVSIIKIDSCIKIKNANRVPLLFAVKKLIYYQQQSFNTEHPATKNMMRRCQLYRDLFESDFTSFVKSLYLFEIFTAKILTLNKKHRDCDIYKLSSAVNHKKKVISNFECSTLKCMYYKNKRDCHKIKSPFNFYHELNFLRSRYTQNNNTKKNYFFLTIELRFDIKLASIFGLDYIHRDEYFMFLILAFFCTNAVANCSISITDGTRRYNNISPIILNFDSDAVMAECEKALSALNSIDLNISSNLKANKLLKKISDNKHITVIDNAEKKYSLLKFAQSNVESTKQCYKNCVSVARTMTNMMPRANCIVLSNKNILSDLCAKKPRALSNKLADIIAINYNSNTIDTINYDVFKEYIESIDKLVNNLADNKIKVEVHARNIINKYHAISSDKNLSIFKNTHQDFNLFCNVCIFVYLFDFEKEHNSSADIDKINLDIAESVYKYIINNIKSSFYSRYNKELFYEDKILDFINNNELSYFFRRDIYRKFNCNSKDAELNQALENLMQSRIILKLNTYFTSTRGRKYGDLFYCLPSVLWRRVPIGHPTL